MGYKVLDIYKDLPRTNCGACGKEGCFAFATAVYLEGLPLSGCPEIDEDRRDAMEARLGEGRSRGEGRKPEAHQQALAFLLGKVAAADLAKLAASGGAEYLPGPPEEIRIPFLGSLLRVRKDDVAALDGQPPSVWVKIFLLIYLTRAKGTPPVGEWVAFRELPNTVSKSKSFEASAERIARAFQGELPRLDAAARALGCRNPRESLAGADRAYLFKALPRVELLFLFWDRQEDFPAHAAILVDRGLLDYLDQEAAVFLAEAFATRFLGGAVTEVIP